MKGQWHKRNSAASGALFEGADGFVSIPDLSGRYCAENTSSAFPGVPAPKT